MFEVLVPLLVGGVVGWLIFYFIRQYDRFTSATLLGTLTALIGGDVIAFGLAMKDQLSDPMFHLWYFVGELFSFMPCIFWW